MKKTITILVVDDDEEIGFMLKLMLEHKGFSVIILQRVEQTEKVLKNNKVDLVILDMLIAGEKGTDLCIQLKNNPATSRLPVMMITALPDAETICALAGADDFLSKPFEMDEIISKVNYLLNKKQPV
jgi:DNA-binding response OmpR family regulator